MRVGKRPCPFSCGGCAFLQPCVMKRIASWNLAGRWTDAHREFLLGLQCDVLLVTEVSERMELADHHLHRSVQLMAARRRWAAVLSNVQLTPLPDPHSASAMAVVDGITY